MYIDREKINENITSYLNNIIKTNNFNQKQLAQLLDISEAQMTRLLNKKRNYTLENIIKISYFTQTSVDELLCFTQKESV